MRKKNSEFETGYFTETGLTPTNKGHFAFIELDNFACWVAAEKLDSCDDKNSAKIVVEEILNDFIQKPSLSKSRIKQYLEKAHQKLIRESKQIMLRCSLVMVVTDYSNIVWAVAGNVRLYHFRQGNFNFRSKDQTMAQLMLDAGNLGEEEINLRNERNALINYLGISTEFKPSISTPYHLEEGDQILLCTLGFWENLKTAEITGFFSALSGAKECAAKLREVLLNRKAKPARNYLIAVISMSRIAKGASLPWLGLLRKITIVVFLGLLGGIGFLFNQGPDIKFPLFPQMNLKKAANLPVKPSLKPKAASAQQVAHLHDLSPDASVTVNDSANQTGERPDENGKKVAVSNRPSGWDGDSQNDQVEPESRESRNHPEEAKRQREIRELRKAKLAAEQARKQREAEELRKEKLAAEQARKQREAEELRKEKLAAEQARKQREAEELRKQKAAAEKQQVWEEARKLREAEEWQKAHTRQAVGKQGEAEEPVKTPEAVELPAQTADEALSKPAEMEKPTPSVNAGSVSQDANNPEMKLNQARAWEKAGDEKYRAVQYDEALKLYKMAQNAYQELGRNREAKAVDHKINDTINQKLLFQIKQWVR